MLMLPSQMICFWSKEVTPKKGDQSRLPMTTVMKPTMVSVRASATVSEYLKKALICPKAVVGSGLNGIGCGYGGDDRSLGWRRDDGDFLLTTD